MIHCSRRFANVFVCWPVPFGHLILGVYSSFNSEYHKSPPSRQRERISDSISEISEMYVHEKAFVCL